ncbi:MAG: gephyrin-like molybdotransferase Glp [Pseudomonadota bacterium]
MFTVEQARKTFAESVRCQQLTEAVSLAAALQRVAAVDVASEIRVPPDANSAMDGFAVHSADLQDGQTTLPISQRIAAGQQSEDLEPGTAARIFTGGMMPGNADAVVIQENCEYAESGDEVKVVKPVTAGANVRPAGQDIAIGAQIVKRGKRLSAVDLGLLASIGESRVTVYAPLKVAIFSTGDELVEPGQILQAGQIYNSNRTMLMALCQQLGFDPIDCGIVEDTLEATKAALEAAGQQADIILTSGGVSVGEEDHIKPAVEALGELNHWKVQMKPGKPVVFGCVQGTPIMGLPGNPVSSYVVFQLLAVPVLRTLQGEVVAPLQSHRVEAAFSKAKVSREEYIRVRLNVDSGSTEGLHASAELFDNQSSGVLSSLTWADGLVRQRIDQTINSGDLVEFLPLTAGML